MSNKENIEKLSELRAEALKIIESYNQLAEQENYETRIGVIDASFDVYDMKYEKALETLESDDEEPSDELVESMTVDIQAKLKSYDTSPYWTTQFPGTKEHNWEPSGINC